MYKILITCAVLGLFSVSAMAADNITVVTLVIPPGMSVEYQDDTVDFSSSTDVSTSDYYWPGPDWIPTGGGMYLPVDGTSTPTWPNTGDKASTDAFANGYYEARDTAYMWVQTNSSATMTITPSGDLTSGTDTLPTRFAMVGSGDWTNGFYYNGGWANDGNIPGDGAGAYAFDAGGMTLGMGGGAFHPVQEVFTMTGGAWTFPLPGVCQGNLAYQFRVKRTSEWPAVLDAAGTYTATMTTAFTQP